jgi:membrane protease YdiL (CAAX protease family)
MTINKENTNEIINKNNRSPQRIQWTFLIFFVVFVGISFVLPWEISIFHEFITILVPVAVYLFIFRKKRNWKEILKFRKLSGINVRIIFQFFFSSLFLSWGINILVLNLTTMDTNENVQFITSMATNPLVLLVSLVIMPAFLEEFLTRGILLDQQHGELSMHKTAWLVGLLFGILHVNLGQLPNTLMLGVIMTYLVLITGSIWSSIIFHALFNGWSYILLMFISFISSLAGEGGLDEIMASEETVVVTQTTDITQVIIALVIALVFLLVGFTLCRLSYKQLIRHNQPLKKPESDVPWWRVFITLPMGLIVVLYGSLIYLLSVIFI